MKHKIIPVILCLMLCMALMPAAAFAEGESPAAQSDTWTDYAAESFAGGSGTEDDPYQIGTPEQLAKLAKDVNEGTSYAGKYFKLTADLDLSEYVWMPIGLQRTNGGNWELISKPFAGSFDGGGRTISGMVVDQRKSLSERYSGGLFGLIRNTGTEDCGVRNLTIAGGQIYFNGDDGSDCMGNGILAGVTGIAGNDSYRVDFEGITISGGSIQCFGGERRDRIAGGMLGYVTNARVSDCSVENIRIFGVSNSGGFAGRDLGSVYRNCTATGELSGHYSLGGFIGYTDYFHDYDKDEDVESVFEYCLADVDITADDWCAGGFMGWAKYAHIFNCVAKGNVTSTKSNEDPRAGAFVGVMEGCNIEKSHAAGRVTEVAPDYEAGGFAAHFFGSGNKFKDCSFDSTLNNDIKAIGGGAPQDYEGIMGVPTQQVKANICRDYDGNHTLMEVTGKEATCTEDGVETYWKCDTCGSMYSDKGGTTMIDSPVTIKATGHKFGDWKVIKEAKVGVEGSRERACVNCDYTEMEAIPALEAEDTAKTGDDSTPALYGILALLAAGGAAGTIYRRRKV